MTGQSSLLILHHWASLSLSFSHCCKCGSILQKGYPLSSNDSNRMTPVKELDMCQPYRQQSAAKFKFPTTGPHSLPGRSSPQQMSRPCVDSQKMEFVATGGWMGTMNVVVASTAAAWSVGAAGIGELLLLLWESPATSNGAVVVVVVLAVSLYVRTYIRNRLTFSDVKVYLMWIGLFSVSC